MISVDRQSLHPLSLGGGDSGDALLQAHAALTDLCRQAWGPGSPLFAKPAGDARTLAWQPPSGAPAFGFYELDETSRRNLQARLGRRVGELRRALGEMAKTDAAKAQALSTLVRTALEIPGWHYLFAVDGEPMLAGWGHLDAANPRPQGLVLALDDGLAPPRLPVRPIGVWSALGAIALALLLLGVGSALWLPTGWLPFDVAQASCKIDEAQRIAFDDLQRQADLTLEQQRRLNELRRALMQAQAACPIQKVELPPPPPPAPDPPKRDADADRDRDKAKQRGAKDGKLQFILAWDNVADLDLYVQCPLGIEIGARQQTGCNGGRLDLDANGYGNARGLVLMRDPVEQISWSTSAPNGTYRVGIHTFAARANQPTERANYRLSVFYDGKLIQSKKGSVSYRGDAQGFTVDEVLSVRIPPQ